MSNGIRVILGTIGGVLLLLAGICSKPMRATRRAAMQTNVSRLNQRAPDSDTRVLVLLGSSKQRKLKSTPGQRATAQPP